MEDKLSRLAATLQNPHAAKLSAGEEVIEVSRPASSAASLYEKVRVAVDYQEEHLLRRNAILRIVKRFYNTEMDSEGKSKTLLTELIWAQYLPNDEVPTSLIKKLIPIFEKYQVLLLEVDQLGKGAFYVDWVLEVCSTELEYAITPPVEDEALVSYMYEEMRGRIEWDPRLQVAEEQKDLFTYIAIHETLLRSNRATLRFRVLSLYYPKWPGLAAPDQLELMRANLVAIIDTVEHQISNPITTRLTVRMRRKVGVFMVMRELIEKHGDGFEELIENPDKLDKEVKKSLEKRTETFSERLRRKVFRTVLFVFVTKIILAFLIEVPYELLIAKHANWVPLAVNVMFHPIVLGMVGMTVSVPKKKNESDYIEAVRALVIGAKSSVLNLRINQQSFGPLEQLFSILYAIVFVFTYGLIAALLVQLNFSWVSILEFLFFLSVVTFFGIRVRTNVKDIVISEGRSGWIGTLFDVFMLPLVRAGQWLSIRVSKINVFIYFFDFIVEAPLKVAIKLFEQWINFVREKKEEI
jgi:hypothetical protein